MSSSDGSFSKARVESFSDGVMAVIITILVLDLKAPGSGEPATNAPGVSLPWARRSVREGE
jgi:uncharacterized membrane protein